MIPDPPDALAPPLLHVELVEADTLLYRIHPQQHAGVPPIPDDGTLFNPGLGDPKRFSPFGDPTVPTIYLGADPAAALYETVLHDVLAGGAVAYSEWRGHRLSVIQTARPLRLASFRGRGLRRLNIDAQQLTDTPPRTYRHTVRWAESVHQHTDLDGVVWMSRQLNTAGAFMLFGDRIRADDLVAHPAHAESRLFWTSSGLDWLSLQLAEVDVVLDHAPYQA